VATTGQVAPATAVSAAFSTHNSNAWVSPTAALTGPDATSNSDTTHCASITAATFDSPDQGEVLELTGFDFSAIPDGATVLGVTCRVGAFFTTGQGSGSIDLVQLMIGGAVSGSTNQAASPVALTGTFTDSYTFGSSSDLWNEPLEAGSGTNADIKKTTTFGVAIGMKATAANADVFIDWVTLEVEYTSPLAGARSMTVTATQTANGAAGMSMTVEIYRGAADPADQAGAVVTANPFSAPGFDQTITTLAAGSVIFGACALSASTAGFTWDANTGGSSVADATHTRTYGTFSRGVLGVAGAYTAGASAPATGTGAYVAAEIQAAAGQALTAGSNQPAGVSTTTAQLVSTAAFIPAPGNLLIAKVASNANSGAGTLGLSVTGGGLNWTQVVFSQQTGINAAAAVWIAKVDTLTDADPVVTAVQQASPQAGMMIRVYALTGASQWLPGGTGTQAGAAAHEASLTASQAGSLVYGAAYGGLGGTFTAEAGTTKVDDLADLAFRYGTFRSTAATTGPGSIGPYGFSAPAADGCAAVAELMATSDGGGLVEDASSPPSALAVAEVVSTAAFSPPEPSVLVALVASTGAGGQNTVAVSGMGLPWSELVRSNPAGKGYAGVWWALVPDAVIQSGVPLTTRSATSPVTGQWGTGQNRTAGNLLVAVLTSGAATSTAALAQNAGTSGWTNRVENGNSGTANARVSIWTKTAAGADAAPAFTSTLSGTAAMTCTLLEYTGADTANPVDTSGTYASGSSSGTLTSMSATTTAAVSTAGAAAISVFCQERAATTVTWSETGTGWSSAYTDGATSSVAHTQVNTQAGVAQGGTRSDSGGFSTKTTAFGAGAVLVIRSAPVPTPPGLSPVTAGNPVNAGRETPVIIAG
jgi:hypothetical protein